ncbi:Porin P precursor [Lignipirellula cremea]|uniref:Porin P n=2 Tax=Lignipirellula cremea TaxID=2528010 RepID=A0A518DUJ8_9BACT|nr:Porin P precursor [Lignipirellula cremea]
MPQGAAETDIHERLRLLEAEVLSLRERQHDMLRATPTGDSNVSDYLEQLPAVTATAPAAPPTGAKSKPAWPTVNVHGFFHADVGWFAQSALNIASVGDAQDGADFRRARLSASGDVARNVGYFMEYDFGFAGRPSFMDVYLDVRELSVGTLRIGQWRQPFGMDGLTSVKDILFLERSLPFMLTPFRQIGVGVFNTFPEERGTWAASTFRFPVDFYGGNVGDNGGFGMATRFTGLPYYQSDAQMVHLGFGYIGGDPANDLVRYQMTPEFFLNESGGPNVVPSGVPLGTPSFVDTGPIDTNFFHMINLEAAASYGSFHVQSEAYHVTVDRIADSTVNFFGAYAQMAYILTGEVRKYNKAGGAYGGVDPRCDFAPNCGWGAWEVATRYSYIDLNDDNVQGGRLTNLTFGVNWYLNPRAKFQFNYIHSFLDNPVFDRSDASIFAARAQLVF